MTNEYCSFILQPLYTIEAQGIELEYLTEAEYNFIQNAFAERFNSSNQGSIMRARQAVAFIKEYALEDIMVYLYIFFTNK